jgi:glycosyltransferase involved in cell wall biosynthesis
VEGLTLLSLIVPIFRNEENLPALLAAVADLARQLDLEAVFVIDGSPDRCAEILERELPKQPMRTRLVQLSRNFGAFAAVTAGLQAGTGEYFAGLAADLQEPPEVILEFNRILTSGAADIVFGRRDSRDDPWLSRVLSKAFWFAFRRLAVRDLVPGGVDTFACTRQVRDVLLSLKEADSSLVALLFWIGFRRGEVGYGRRRRAAGKSAWTFAKRLNYAVQSIFNFTDIPIRVLIAIGVLGSAFAAVFGMVVFIAHMLNRIPVPGYTALVLVILFYGGLTIFGLGVVGQYVWLCLQNSHRRPKFVVRTVSHYGGAPSGADTAGTP